MPARWIKDTIYNRPELVISVPSNIYGEHRVHVLFESTFIPKRTRYQVLPYSHHYQRSWEEERGGLPELMKKGTR